MHKTRVFIFFTFFLAVTGYAQTVTWDGSTDSVWSQPDTTSWGGSTYNSGNLAEFLGAGAGTITVSGTVTPGGITVNSSADYSFITGVIGGTGSLVKAESGTLTLSGANTYSGGTTLSGGRTVISAANNLGDSSGSLTFTGNAELNTIASFSSPRSISINNGVVATFLLGVNNGSVNSTFTGPVSGAGGIGIRAAASGNQKNLILSSTNHTFTGPIVFNNSANVTSFDIELNSLVDSSSPITFTAGSLGTLKYGAGASSPMTLDSRQIILTGSGTSRGAIENASTQPIVINQDLLVSSVGNATLELRGSGSITNQFNGNIADGVSNSVNVTISNWRELNGTNSHSGTTRIEGGTLWLQGAHTMSTSTTYYMQRSTGIRFYTDDSGIVNLGNRFNLNAIDTSSGIVTRYDLHVGNNGGSTTNTTIVVGRIDFVAGGGNFSSARNIRAYGKDGYRLQVGDVVMNVTSPSTASQGNQGFQAISAPITIAGTVKQVNGNAGNTTANVFYLGGTLSGNMVTGTLADPDDLGSNTNAVPLHLKKGESSDWALASVNTFTGPTTVNGGTLTLAMRECLPDTGSLTINSGIVHINSNVKEKVGSLYFGVSEQVIGSWGSSTSRAQNKDDARFSGTGVLYVGVDVPGDGTLIVLR